MIHPRSALARTIPLALLAALAGCATLSGESHPLDDTSWRLTDVETSGTSTQLTADLSSRHTLTFESDGDLRIQLDCNRGTSQWSASQPQSSTGSIEIGPVASTRALCQRPTFGEELASELPSAQSYTLLYDRARLEIITPDKVYVFARD